MSISFHECAFFNSFELQYINKARLTKCNFYKENNYISNTIEACIGIEVSDMELCNFNLSAKNISLSKASGECIEISENKINIFESKFSYLSILKPSRFVKIDQCEISKARITSESDIEISDTKREHFNISTEFILHVN